MSIVTVRKLAKNELQLCSLPENSQILSVFVKQEEIYISTKHDVNAKMWGKRVKFAIFRNGRHFNVDEYNFLGTIVLDFGSTICQVFFKEV